MAARHGPVFSFGTAVIAEGLQIPVPESPPLKGAYTNERGLVSSLPATLQDDIARPGKYMYASKTRPDLSAG